MFKAVIKNACFSYIEIVGVEGGGGGSEARIGKRKFSMDGRREKLGGGVTQKCIMVAMEKGF